MKEVLEKFGLVEFFAYICPGLILLTSLALWTRLNFDAPFWKQEALVIVLVLILSYILGLILASFNDMSQRQYHRSIGAIRILYSFPSPRFTPSVVQANLTIAEDLERLAGGGGLSSLASPWDRLVIYRALVASRLGDRGKAILAEADILHRRFRFAMGVALAVFLVAIQSFFRLILVVLGFFLDAILTWNSMLPSVSPILLLCITAIGLWASFELRRFAIRMWELERYLSSSLSNIP